MSLIRLTKETRGDVPEAVLWLVEVWPHAGNVMPPFFLSSGKPYRWLSVPEFERVVGQGHVEIFRFARPAEPHEIPGEDLSQSGTWVNGECVLPGAAVTKPLTFGRYMVEVGKAYEIPAPHHRIELPSTPATYALLQAAWREHFGVKVGTRVRVVRAWAEKGDLSFIHPYPLMLALVGQEFVVEGLLGHGVHLGPCHYAFPFHVLEPLPEPTIAVEKAKFHEHRCRIRVVKRTISDELVYDSEKARREGGKHE